MNVRYCISVLTIASPCCQQEKGGRTWHSKGQHYVCIKICDAFLHVSVLCYKNRRWTLFITQLNLSYCIISQDASVYVLECKSLDPLPIPTQLGLLYVAKMYCICPNFVSRSCRAIVSWESPFPHPALKWRLNVNYYHFGTEACTDWTVM